MRVITGTAKGHKLSTPPGLDTRPTSEMVKEAVFSIIQFEIEGARVLDLFAGTGQLGIEALSRGAYSASFVDKSKTSTAVINENLIKTKLKDKARVLTADVLTFVNSTTERFDIVFIDPPYSESVDAEFLNKLSERINDSGIIICETDNRQTLPENAGEFGLKKEYKYGKTKITTYRKTRKD